MASLDSADDCSSPLLGHKADSTSSATSSTRTHPMLTQASSSDSSRPVCVDPGGLPGTTLALEAAQLLNLSLGVGRRALAVAAMGALLALAIGPEAAAIRPFVYFLLAVVAVYFIVLERRGPRAAAYVIPAGQVAAALCFALTAAVAPAHVVRTILQSEQEAAVEPFRWLSNLAGGTLLMSQALPLRTKFAASHSTGALYGAGLLLCAFRSGAPLSAAFAPIAAELILLGLGVLRWPRSFFSRITRCDPLIAHLESIVSDASDRSDASAPAGATQPRRERVEQMAEEKERLDWDLRFANRSLGRMARENEVLAFELQRAAADDEPSSSSSSSRNQPTRLSPPAHPPDDDGSSHNTAKMTGATPYQPG